MITEKIIAVFTGTRAEFGILKPLLLGITKNKGLILKLFVGGTHLSHEYGNTKQEILDEGLKIYEELNFLIKDNGETNLPASIASAIEISAISLEKLQPDMAVILGDRFEALGFGLACFSLRIPIAHIHGGEVTDGALDDAFRHCLTKLSSIHFAASERYRKRIIQLGQHPSTVFNVGPLSRDNIRSLEVISKNDLFQGLGLETPDGHIALFSLHPETKKSSAYNRSLVKNILHVLDEFCDLFIFISSSNNDVDGHLMNREIRKFVLNNKNRVFYKDSFGQNLFHQCLYHSDFVIGNSSSGLIEAPMLDTITINIGNRQSGREHYKSVISVPNVIDQITEAINSALARQKPKRKRKHVNLTTVTEQIIKQLISFDNKCVSFYDLDFE